MSLPLVTIIVPSYNSSAYIVEALNSCLKQGYKNIELLISDDQSSDDTPTKVVEWLGKHEKAFVNAKFIQQKENLGVTANTNFLIETAQGEYVRLLESDDVLVENSIKNQIQYISESDEEILFLFSDLLIFSDSVKSAKIEKPAKDKFIQATAHEQYQMLLYGQQANGPSVFFHRKKILDLAGYVGARNCSDWTTAIKLTFNNVKIHYYPKPLLYYRRHETNISTRENLSWKEISYEMKKIRNKEFLKPELKLIDRLYCFQDLLKAKKKAKHKLTARENFSLFSSSKMYRVLQSLA